MGKARRKDKDSSQTPQDEHKLYLEDAVLDQKISDADLQLIIELPQGLDYNEWLASHSANIQIQSTSDYPEVDYPVCGLTMEALAFFEHINLIYGTISEFCTMSGCPDMSGPSYRQYLWFDEKGKKCKVAAPQYIDYVMTFTQKTINDESIFPTKYANDFPSSFESIVKKIHRLLFHVVAHMYYAHFKELLLLSLHSHLNCIFAHLILFNERFKLIDEKETEILQDLVVALKLHTENQLSASADEREKAVQDEMENENSEKQKSNGASASVLSTSIASENIVASLSVSESGKPH